MISSRLIEMFEVLVAHGHFGRAAESLAISQPALSKGIQRLEAEFAVPLLDRSAGRVVPTHFGEVLLRRGRMLQAEERALREEIASLAGRQGGHLAIAFGPYPGLLSGYVALGQFMAKYPGIAVRANVASWREVARQVSAGNADLGIAEISGLQGRVEYVTTMLAQHRAHFVCRSDHPLMQDGAMSLERLLDYPWISARLPPRVASLLPIVPVRAGHVDLGSGDFVPAIEVDVPMQLDALLRSSDAIAISTLTMVCSELLAGKLTVVPAEGLQFQSAYGFISRADRSLSPSASGFMDIVREIECSLVDEERRLAQHLGISIDD